MPAYFRTPGVPRPASTYRANTVSPTACRGLLRRANPPTRQQPAPIPPLMLRGWDRMHPPTNGAREVARRLRQAQSRAAA